MLDIFLRSFFDIENVFSTSVQVIATSRPQIEKICAPLPSSYRFCIYKIYASS